jgi:hypothetical protein
MAKANRELITKLHEAADKIENSNEYNWGHVGRCNCGHLAQCVTPLDKKEIYAYARIQELDEWTEYANDYCPQSGAPMDTIMDAMFEIGMELQDIHNLEYLSDKKVLEALPGGFRYLEKGKKHNAALYMHTWADVLETELDEKESPVFEMA